MNRTEFERRCDPNITPERQLRVTFNTKVESAVGLDSLHLS